MRARAVAATAAMLAVMAGHAVGADSRGPEENQKIVQAFYEAAINRKDFEVAAKFLGPRYVQHNQNAEDGAEGLRNFIGYLREKFPLAHSEIKKVFANGDYVILHVHAKREPGSRGMAIVDIFRLEHGRIVEHWDVHEDLVEKPANRNGMF